MKNPAVSERVLLLALAKHFYTVVPLEMRTHCSLTAAISQAVLHHFGIASTLLPCQVWCITPTKNYVVGFVRRPPVPGKWDGHLVCSTGTWFIDAALHHFNAEFSLNLPSVAVASRFRFPTQAIGRFDLSEQDRLWWCNPPASINSPPPEEPAELVAKYAGELIEILSATDEQEPD